MNTEIEDQEIEIKDPSYSLRKSKKSKEPSYFEVMLNCCFFENTDEPSDAAAELLKNDPEMNNNSVIQSMSVIERERGY